MKLENELFVCIDCETTGLDPETDRVIEIAAAKFNMRELLEQKENLIDPECDIPPSSIEIHHITPDMVKNKPKIQEVLSEYITFIGGNTLVGHGVAFDIKLIVNAAKRFEIPCTIANNRSIDTLRLARLYGESPSNSLEQLRQHFNIEAEGAHRALGDVVVNIAVFRYLANRFASVSQIEKTLEKPIGLKIMPLGKHKGRSIKEVPIDYLRWAAHQNFDQDLLFTIRSEINRRKSSNDFSSSSNPFSSL